MPSYDLEHQLTGAERDTEVIAGYFAREGAIKVYPASVNRLEGNYFFMGRKGNVKSLYVLMFNPSASHTHLFPLAVGDHAELESGATLIRCELNHAAASAIRQLFPFTRPQLLGNGRSFGFGDRLGIATPGHIHALRGCQIRPVFAQQSIRELERTGRQPEDVMDAAAWGVFQEGWRDGYGADADHLKTPADIDRMAGAGFTMFTIDPGEYVGEDADTVSVASLSNRASRVDWSVLSDTIDTVLARYVKKGFSPGDGLLLMPDRETVLRAVVKYGNVIAHAISMHRHLADRWPGIAAEIELSVDETDTATSPFDHYFIVNELRRSGIQLTSIAPRFIGDFEKGVDYRGNIGQFREEYQKHAAIARAMGEYKLSLHSGSDKFSVYEVIGLLPEHGFHVKTAGTSYLVALETLARTSPALFRNILAFSRDHYEVERRSYHVSAELTNIPEPGEPIDDSLADLFSQDDVRQVLHVAFGRVLTACDSDGEFLFRDGVMRALDDHEEFHYSLLHRHFQRHLIPLTG